MKEKIYKLFNPSNTVITIGIIFTIISLIYLILNKFNTPLQYILYLIMSYSFIIFCIKIYKIVKEKINKIIDNNKYLSKYKNDANLRYKISIFKSLVINAIYGIFKLITGILYKSVWFISFGLYYFLLIMMRSNIAKEELNDKRTLKSEYIKYRKVGVMLLLMNVILTMIILIIVNQKIVIVYSTVVSITIATYTFFILASSVLELIKYRKYKSPLMTAAKVINVVASLISLLSMEIVMLSTFGQNNSIVFKEIMIMATGGFISIIIIVISLQMIFKSTEWLREN